MLKFILLEGVMGNVGNDDHHDERDQESKAHHVEAARVKVVNGTVFDRLLCNVGRQ